MTILRPVSSRSTDQHQSILLARLHKENLGLLKFFIPLKTCFFFHLETTNKPLPPSSLQVETNKELFISQMHVLVNVI